MSCLDFNGINDLTSLKARFSQLDIKKDGKISREESSDDVTAYDRDKSGTVELWEYMEAINSQAKEQIFSQGQIQANKQAYQYLEGHTMILFDSSAVLLDPSFYPGNEPSLIDFLTECFLADFDSNQIDFLLGGLNKIFLEYPLDTSGPTNLGPLLLPPLLRRNNLGNLTLIIRNSREAGYNSSQIIQIIFWGPKAGVSFKLALLARGFRLEDLIHFKSLLPCQEAFILFLDLASRVDNEEVLGNLRKANSPEDLIKPLIPYARSSSMFFSISVTDPGTKHVSMRPIHCCDVEKRFIFLLFPTLKEEILAQELKEMGEGEKISPSMYYLPYRDDDLHNELLEKMLSVKGVLTEKQEDINIVIRNASFRAYIAQRDLSFANIFSFAQGIDRYINKYLRGDFSPKNIESAVTVVGEQRDQFQRRVIIDENTSIITFTHEEKRFQNEDITNFASRCGAKKFSANFKGSDDKEAFLSEVRKRPKEGKGNRVIWYNGHGSKETMALKDRPVSYQELGDALIESGNIVQTTIILGSCHSRDFAVKLYKYIEKKITAMSDEVLETKGIKRTDKPLIITIANKGAVGWGGGFLVDDRMLEALYYAHQAGPLTGEEFLRVEGTVYPFEDMAILIPYIPGSKPDEDLVPSVEIPEIPNKIEIKAADFEKFREIKAADLEKVLALLMLELKKSFDREKDPPEEKSNFLDISCTEAILPYPAV